jgi:AraC-like DNA-binding protein
MQSETTNYLRGALSGFAAVSHLGRWERAMLEPFSALPHPREPDPVSHLAAWRRQKAAYLREMGTLSIAQIAERVGYTSELTFAKAFRRLMGMPPGAYARQHTNHYLAPAGARPRPQPARGALPCGSPSGRA